MFDREARKRVWKRLKREGFDETTSGESGGVGYVRPRCSQCEACCIQGVACHETGCLNYILALAARRRRHAWVNSKRHP